MKKLTIITLSIIFAVMLSSQAFAAWTLVPSAVGHTTDRHMFRWKVECTSDGAALAITDLLALMPDNLRREVQRSLLMIMDIDPGDTGGEPDVAFTVTISNAEAMSVFATTTSDATTTVTGIDMSEDWNQYIPVHERLYLTITDIGAAADAVTIYIEGWIPEGR